MKRFGVISTAVLFCLVGTTAPAYAQQDQQGTNLTKHEEQAKAEKRTGNKQAKSEQQRWEHAQQIQEQQDRAQQRRLAEENDLKSELAGIDPPFVGYRELRKALVRYMRLARRGPPVAIRRAAAMLAHLPTRRRMGSRSRSRGSAGTTVLIMRSYS